MKKTKIIATIGPASIDKKILAKMVEAGLDAVRINSAHGDLKQYDTIIKNVKSIGDIPVLLDVKGPEIRILSEKDYHLKKGDTIKINLSPSLLYFNHRFSAKKGQKVLINDGLYQLEIVSLSKDTVVLKAQMDLDIVNKVRANIPGVEYDMPILSDNDKKVLQFTLKKGIDYVALSYTRNKEDVHYVRKFLEGKNVSIISKIENIDAVKNFDEILEASDGIMVARGDLGVELSSEKLPLIQKDIIRKCNQAGKLVITATQMLQSMIDNPLPTRAETSDVANAILDGTDAIMLSAETAAGKYPVLAVREMAKIAAEVEPNVKNLIETNTSSDISGAISKSIYEMTKILPISKIITFTNSGYTARIISRFRLNKDIIAITKDNPVRKELELYYGIRPFVFPEMPTRERILKVAKFLFRKKLINKEDMVLFTASVMSLTPKSTNLIEIHKVKDLLSLK
jgi:pyruvate kinase